MNRVLSVEATQRILSAIKHAMIDEGLEGEFAILIELTDGRRKLFGSPLTRDEGLAMLTRALDQQQSIPAGGLLSYR